MGTVISIGNVGKVGKASSNWVQIGGKLKQVSISGNKVCGQYLL